MFELTCGYFKLTFRNLELENKKNDSLETNKWNWFRTQKDLTSKAFPAYINKADAMISVINTSNWYTIVWFLSKLLNQ